MKAGIIALVLVVAAMLVGTKLYTDSRYEASQGSLESELALCATLRETGGGTPEQLERCAHPWSRDGDRNAEAETIAMALYGGTALVALVGLFMIFRARRRGQAAAEQS